MKTINQIFSRTKALRFLQNENLENEPIMHEMKKQYIVEISQYNDAKT